MTNFFEDPKGFLPESVFAYLDRDRTAAKINHVPREFRVREPVPGRRGEYLSIGPGTDYPDDSINYPYGRCPTGLPATATPWYGNAPKASGVSADRVSAAILVIPDVDPATVVNSIATKLGLERSRIQYREIPKRDRGPAIEVVIEGFHPEELRRRLYGDEPFILTKTVQQANLVVCVLEARSGCNLERARQRLIHKLRLDRSQTHWRKIDKGDKQIEFRAEIDLAEFNQRAREQESFTIEHIRSAFMVAVTLGKERLPTLGACDWLATELTKILGREVRSKRISNSGLKDRWAETAQTIVVEGVTVDEIRKAMTRLPAYSPGRAGFTIKDPRHAYDRVYKGDHGVNRFEITVRMNGTAQEIDAYLAPRLEKLKQRDMWIPNAFGRQRLGRRQNLHVIGRTLVVNDHQMPAHQNMPQFASAAEAACYRFLFESTPSEPADAAEVRRQAEGMWLYQFRDMAILFDKHYRQYNLGIEKKMAERLADVDKYEGSFERVLDSMWDEVSLFVAAWQSWWWNLVLSKKMYGWLKEMDTAKVQAERKGNAPCHCGGNGHTCDEEGEDTRRSGPCKACRCPRCSNRELKFNPSKKSIPILMATQQAREWYGRLPYCREGVRELSRADDDVREMFLVPRNRRDGQPKPYGPWRKAFIKVENFSHYTGDGTWTATFDLRSGSYATTFLLMLFDLIDPDEHKRPDANGGDTVSVNDLEEVTD